MGNQIRAWRELRGLTQEQLAERIGTSCQTISRLELGRRGLSDKWIERLIAALRCTATQLLHEPPSAAGEASSDQGEQSIMPVEQLLVRELRDFMAKQDQIAEALQRLTQAIVQLERTVRSQPDETTRAGF